MAKAIIFVSLVYLLSSGELKAQRLLNNPDSVHLHTEDIDLFWKVFDETSPRFEASAFQSKYLDAGSDGLKGFIRMRIESGKNLSNTIKGNLAYYEHIRESSLSIKGRSQILFTFFHRLKELYPAAVFPDVYFVIGAKNTGGTTFSGGLIIGAEMFGKKSEGFEPRLDIETLELIVVHELIHYQQQYATDKTLLAQSIREGAADFVCELVAGRHPYAAIHEYGNQHEAALWKDFSKNMYGTNWSPWLYYSKDKTRPQDLGYWMGYKIVKAYYEQIENKSQALHDILNISDFQKFYTQSGYPDKE